MENWYECVSVCVDRVRWHEHHNGKSCACIIIHAYFFHRRRTRETAQSVFRKPQQSAHHNSVCESCVNQIRISLRKRQCAATSSTRSAHALRRNRIARLRVTCLRNGSVLPAGSHVRCLLPISVRTCGAQSIILPIRAGKFSPTHNTPVEIVAFEQHNRPAK